MASARRPGTNEVITTFGSAIGRDYSDMSTWEVATQIDCVATQTSPVLECYADSASYNQAVVIAGSVTDAIYHRILRAAPGHAGNGTGPSGIVIARTVDSNVIQAQESYCQVEDIHVSLNINVASTRYCFLTGTGTHISHVGCIAFDSANAGTGDVNGFGISTVTSYAVDCLAYGLDGVGFRGAGVGPTYFYNCTSATTLANYTRISGVCVAVNCLAATNGFTGTFDASSNFNAAANATAPGANSRQSQIFTFMNAGAGDYHLASNDTGAHSFGTNLAENSIFAFDDDIDRTTILTAWSIGADWPTLGVEVTEGAITSEALSTLLRASGEITETADAGDIFASLLVLIVALSESAKVSDSFVTAITALSAINQGVVANDVLATQLRGLSSLLESALAGESFTSQGIFGTAVSDEAVASDLFLTRLRARPDWLETALTLDTWQSQYTGRVLWTEGTLAAETVSVPLPYNVGFVTASIRIFAAIAANIDTNQHYND